MKYESTDRDYLEKLPSETGYFHGESHYYIDGTVYNSGVINVLMYDTDEEFFIRLMKA